MASRQTSPKHLLFLLNGALMLCHALELIENVLAKNAVDLSVHCVADALHIHYENAMVVPNSRSGDQCHFSPASVSYESGALFWRVSAPELDRIQNEDSRLSIDLNANQDHPYTVPRSIGRMLPRYSAFSEAPPADC